MTIEEWTLIEYNKCCSSPIVKDALRASLDQASHDGLWLEFGVGAGNTLRCIVASANETHVVGFDSFEGLTEDWWIRPKGSFRQEIIPDIKGAEIVVGMFEDTVLNWFSTRKDSKITFVHIDCDLYAGAKCALTCIAPYLVPGCIISFDELIGYDGWELHEWKALYETVVIEKLFSFEWLQHVDISLPYAMQASIKII